MANHNTVFQGKISKFLPFGLYLIIFLPVVVLPPTFQPSDWTKGIIFRAIVAVLASFFLFRFFYKRDISLEIPKWKNPVYLPSFLLLGFFVALIASTAFSADPYFSFFGSPVRAGGLLNLLFFFVFSLFLAIFIKEEEWHRLIKANFLAGSVISLVAFIQYFGFLKNIFIKWEAGGPPSLLGNSAFLAIYTLFLVFSAFYYSIHGETKKQKLFYFCLFLVFVFAIFASGSRAGYLGMLASFAFYFLFFPTKYVGSHQEQFGWLTPQKIRTIKIAALIIISLAVLGVSYVNLNLKLPQFIEKNAKVSYFIHNRLSLPIVMKDLAGTRLSAWKITWQAIKERPLFGWGPENSYIGFEKYYDPTLTPGLQKLWWNRPHNIFLEVWSNSGIFAFLLYIGFWIALFWQLQKFKKRNADKKAIFAGHGLQAMFIAYLTALFFQFDGFSTYLISFFFIGYSFYIISSYPQPEKAVFEVPLKFARFKKFFLYGFLAAMALFFWFWHLKPLYLNEKIAYIQNLHCEKALQSLDKTTENYGIIIPYAALKYSDTVKKCIHVQPQKEAEYSQKMLSFLKRASKIQPEYTRTWLFMGSLANVLAAREENKENQNKLVLQARGYLQKSLKLSPKRQEILIELEKNYLIAQDYGMMEKTGKDCVNIDSSNGACYWNLGIAQIFLGNQDGGAKNIALSKEKGYAPPNSFYKQLAVAYLSQKNYKEALSAYQLITPPPADKLPDQAASYYATIAFLYERNGLYEKAGQSALEVFKIQPENEETIKFLRLMLGLKPNSLELHNYLAYIYKKIGEMEKYKQELSVIESVFSMLISQNSKNADYRFTLAKIYKNLEEYEKATDQLAQISMMFPDRRSESEGIVRAMGGHYWAIYAIKMGIK